MAQEEPALYLTGQVVAAYTRARLTPQDFGSPRRRDFAKLNLHLPACRSLGAGRVLFEQPGKDDFFSSLLVPLFLSRSLFRREIIYPGPYKNRASNGLLFVPLCLFFL
jgi:hypothetical protein